MNKVYLYKPKSFIGYLITWVTKAPYSHAAIEIDNILYDSSETRGNFGKSEIINKNRKFICYEVEGDLSVWLESMKGKKYDWSGVIGWIFNVNDRDRFYCFEAVYDALAYLGLTEYTTDRVSSKDIIKILKDNNK